MHRSHIIENSKHIIIRKEPFYFINLYLSIFLLSNLLKFVLSSADFPWQFKLSSHIYFAFTLTSPRYLLCSSFFSPESIVLLCFHCFVPDFLSLSHQISCLTLLYFTKSPHPWISLFLCVLYLFYINFLS